MDQSVGRLDRESWLAAARLALIESGHSAVKVDRLATALNVTRGSFYWHFKNRKDLLDALVAHWEATNSVALFAALMRDDTPMGRLQALAREWVEETDYSPAYDSAMRDWGRTSTEVKRAVSRVDDARIAALAKLFGDAGYPQDEAIIRARITYYHQVGYYAMGVRESRKTRERQLDLYLEVLMGHPPRSRSRGTRNRSGSEVRGGPSQE
jgi:AcrR family transcriptional regulator